MSFKSIPSLGGIADKAILRVLEALKFNQEQALGLNGKNSLDQVITKQGAIDDSIVRKSGSTGIVPITQGWSYSAIPPEVTGLSAVGALSLIHLTWTGIQFPHLAYYEVWRSETDNIGTAVLHGSTKSTVYADDSAKPQEAGIGKTYYYWVRAVSEYPKEGPFNAVAGTPGMVGYDQEYALSILTKKWEASTAYVVGDYVIPTPGNETGVWLSCTTAGTSGTTEPTWPSAVSGTVNDGTAVWTAVAAGSLNKPFYVGEVAGVPALIIDTAYIGDATITSAMIGSVSADVIISGTITATISIVGGVIKTSTGTGWRVEIDDTFPFWYGIGTKNTTNGRVYVDASGNFYIKDGAGNTLFSVSGLYYKDGTLLDDVQPAESGADVTGSHTSNNTSNVGSQSSTNVQDATTRALAIIDGDLNVSGHIQSSTLQSASLYTSGTHLTAACSGGATTLNVKDTTDFATSGSGFIFDSSNNKDAFSWTGKTSTTLTGCSGVLAHNSGAVVVGGKSIVVCNATNETYFVSNRGDGNLAITGSIGINQSGSDYWVASFNTTSYGGVSIQTAATSLYADTSNSNDYAVYGWNYASLGHGVGIRGCAGTGGDVGSPPSAVIGVYGFADGGYGGCFETYSSNYKAPILLKPHTGSAAPSHSAEKGAVWVTSGGRPYINHDSSTGWHMLGPAAWVNFNGAGAGDLRRANYNVSGVTDNGTGDYTINFANSMPDANYTGEITIGDTTNTTIGVEQLSATPTRSTTQYRIQTRLYNGTLVDCTYVNVVIHR